MFVKQQKYFYIYKNNDWCWYWPHNFLKLNIEAYTDEQLIELGKKKT